MSNDALPRIAARIEQRLDRLFTEIASGRGDAIFSSSTPPLLLDQVRDLTLRAGKRFRGVLVICGAALFNERANEDQGVLDAAAALELMHTYFLIHDDIMDEDDMRRGGPSVHAALAQSTGDEKLGRDLAILCGDLACALHERLLATLSASGPRGALANRVFSQMHLDVIHGQTLDILGDTDAEEVASRKTASYTTVGPLTIGASLSGAEQEQLVLLARMARPLGVAFQLRDDLLGVFGKPEVTGKPVGNDLRKGKRTYLIQKALAEAGRTDRLAVVAVHGDATASDTAISRAVEALDASGARHACEDRIDRLVEQSLDALADLPYLAGGVELLLTVAGILGRRDR